MVHVQVHGAAAFCRRIHGPIHIADRTDDKFIHIPVIHIKILKIIHHTFIYFHSFLEIRISIRHHISLTDAVEITHASISAAFDADILPEIVIAQDHFQDLQRPCIFCSSIDEIAGSGNVLYFGRGFKSFVPFSTVDHTRSLSTFLCRMQPCIRMTARVQRSFIFCPSVEAVFHCPKC